MEAIMSAKAKTSGKLCNWTCIHKKCHCYHTSVKLSEPDAESGFTVNCEVCDHPMVRGDRFAAMRFESQVQAIQVLAGVLVRESIGFSYSGDPDDYVYIGNDITEKDLVEALNRSEEIIKNDEELFPRNTFAFKEVEDLFFTVSKGRKESSLWIQLGVRDDGA